MDSKSTINDCRIRVRASEELVRLLENNKVHIKEIPENILNGLKSQSIQLPSSVEIINNKNTPVKNHNINLKLLKEVLKKQMLDHSDIKKENAKLEGKQKQTKSSVNMYLYLSDLRWLTNFLARLREDQGIEVYLNDVLEMCQLELPQNDVIKRNPQLEQRCQKLRAEQANLEYRKMTKNVDAVLKHYPEDTIAYQIKAINSQLIAVLQFIFSVAAGFAFGFLGINLIVGNIEFGLRLLLGIMCALIIALAEIYFLAKKLNEYDNTVDTVNIALKKTVPANRKVHAD